MTDWQPGDVAICIDDKIYSPYGRHSNEGPWMIKLGEKYTVIEVFVREFFTWNPKGTTKGHTVLKFLEITNLFSGKDRGYSACRFVKQPSLVIEEKETTEVEVDA